MLLSMQWHSIDCMDDFMTHPFFSSMKRETHRHTPCSTRILQNKRQLWSLESPTFLCLLISVPDHPKPNTMRGLGPSMVPCSMAPGFAVWFLAGWLLVQPFNPSTADSPLDELRQGTVACNSCDAKKIQTSPSSTGTVLTG